MPLRQQIAGIRVREILPDSQYFGPDEAHVSSCTSDPHRCQRGSLFVAVQSSAEDGHLGVDQALDRGAVAVIAERYLPISAPLYVVPDSREAYGRICHHLAGCPTDALCTVGVTGTNGKTSTTQLIAAVLKAAGCPTGLMNSLAYDDTQRRQAAPCSTPPAHELARWLGRMRDNRCSHAVIEASSQALAERRTAGLELDAAVLTNVRRDHLDFHQTVFNYRRAKARLFEHLKPGGFVVAHADDPASRFLLRDLPHPVLTVGMRREAELSARVVERHPGEQTFLMTAGDETVAVQTRMFGDHHVYNCLSAAAVGLLLGIDLVTVARGLESVTSIEGRMEPLVAGQPFGVYLDHAHTPDSLAATLKALRQVTSGRVLCVLAIPPGGDTSQRPLLGRVLERGTDCAVITGNGAAWQQVLPVAHEILDGYDRPAKAHVLPDQAGAIRWMLGEAGPDDAVLIAATPPSRSRNGKKKPVMDARQVAERWLAQVGANIEYPQPPTKLARLRTACHRLAIN